MGCKAWRVNTLYVQVSVVAISLLCLFPIVAYGKPHHDSLQKRAKTARRRHGRISCGHSPSYAKAYGYIVGSAVPIAETRRVCLNSKGKTEAVSTLFGVTIGSPKTNSIQGTYCFIPKDSSEFEGAVVVTSVVGPGYPNSPSPAKRAGAQGVRYATWIPGAPDCVPQKAGEFEIQTSESLAGVSGLSQVPSAYVDFSFIVP
jgi:hypothetical protein